MIMQKSTKIPRSQEGAGAKPGQTEHALAVVNQTKAAWPFSYLILMLLVALIYGLYELYSMVEPLLGVWSVLSAKLSEVSAVLSAQEAELTRIRSLLSGSNSRAADDPSGGGVNLWELLCRIIV